MSDATSRDETEAQDRTEHPLHAWLPEVHFGTAITPLPEVGPAEPDEEDDEVAETPPDVIWILGFDPADEADEESDDSDTDGDETDADD